MTPERFQPTLGLAIGGRTFAWNERTDASARLLRQGRDAAAASVNVAVAAVAAVAVLLAVQQAFFVTGASVLRTSDVWRAPSLAGFLLSLAALCACFLFYRRVEARHRRISMPSARGAEAASPQPLAGARFENAAELFSPAARAAVEEAAGFAEKYGRPSVAPLHLAVGAMSGNDVALLFARLGISFDAVKDPLAHRLASLPPSSTAGFEPDAEAVLLSALADAWRDGQPSVEPLDVFAAAVKRDPFLVELFYGLSVDESMFANAAAWIRIGAKLRERYLRFRRAAAFKPTGNMDRAMTAVYAPNLDAASQDLTAAAARGATALLIGREREMATLFRAIEGGRRSVLLVGSPGVGKEALLEGLAERMVEEDVPKPLQDKRLLRLALPELLAGAEPAELQERLLVVLGEAVRARNVVLALPDVDQVLAVPACETVLSDVLARGLVFAVATTTPEAYAGSLERAALGRVFQDVDVSEPTGDEAIRILESKVGFLEAEHGVLFSYQAVAQAVALTDRYMHETFLPEKAIELCREVALHVARTRGRDSTVTGEDVAEIVAEKTRIPVTHVAQEEKDALLHLEERMHGRVIGQDEAVSAVAAALRRARAALRSENRPIAVFLFLGPTGVGKTELAKTVAEAYFGSEDAMIRLDMSEYQRPDSVARLLGVPGSGQGGLLTEAVRHNPFSIVLLDELEKANADVLNLFLQVFDDGRLTDAAGRTVDFTNAVIICTSNAGAGFVQDAVAAGTSVEQIRTQLLERELRGVYRPEFLNRFDGVIVFKPLSLEDVQKIARLLVAQVGSRLEPKGIHFRATDEAVAALARKGYDPVFGARPLRRVVQEDVENAIANALLEGRVQRRDTIVLTEGGGIEVEPAPAL